MRNVINYILKLLSDFLFGKISMKSLELKKRTINLMKYNITKEI